MWVGAAEAGGDMSVREGLDPGGREWASLFPSEAPFTDAGQHRGGLGPDLRVMAPDVFGSWCPGAVESLCQRGHCQGSEGAEQDKCIWTHRLWPFSGPGVAPPDWAQVLWGRAGSERRHSPALGGDRRREQ